MIEAAVVAVILAVYAGTLWVVNLRDRSSRATGLDAITQGEIDAEVGATQRRYHPSRRSVWLGRLALFLIMIVLPTMTVFISRLP